MKTNAAGIALIKKFEGLRLEAYRDSVGILTIGYGSTGPHVTEHLKITAARAEELLRQDLDRFEKGVSDLVKVRLQDNEFAALVSLAFNVGLGAFADSTLLRRVNANDFWGAASEFGRWNKAGDQVLEGLTRRREAEKQLFLTQPAGVIAAASDWRLVSPAEDAQRVRGISEAELDLLTWIAGGLSNRYPFTIDQQARKVYFGHRAEPISPAATKAVSSPPVTPSLKEKMQTGDVHIVADRKTRSMSAWSKDGAAMLDHSLSVRLEGVEGGTLDRPIWNVRNSDTPPGTWTCHRVDDLLKNDPDWRAFGWHYCYLRPHGGPALAIGDVGIGIHGGGTGLPDPWAPRQGWMDTLGCLRMQNEDLSTLAILIKRTLVAKRTAFVTTQ